MAIFNVPRAGRRQSNYMERLIGNMYDDTRSFFKQGYGICDLSSSAIICSFYSVRNTYYKVNPIKIHYMELFVEYEVKKPDVLTVADCMGRFLFECGYQAFVSVIDIGNQYLIAVVVNAVSYRDGSVFYDNNTCYLELYQVICRILPYGCNVKCTENTFFDSDKREGNYVHGVYA